MRKFEKISWEIFKKEVGEDKNCYQNLSLPKLKTQNSAGYDIELLSEVTLKPGEIKKIPTGIKIMMQPDEVVFLIVRSSIGFKYNIRLCNQVGVIDADYYNNETNEGHVWLSMQNEGENEQIFKKGDCLVQAIFLNPLKTDEKSGKIRKGGLGSTTGGDENE